MPATPKVEAWYLETVSGQRRGLLASLTRGLLAAISWGYGLGVAVRELTYQLGLVKPVRVAAKTISVGNLTLGGTGKTPAVIHLARHYQAAGEMVAVLIRGHGASRLAGCNIVHDGRSAQLGVAEAGDEALLIGRLLGNVPVLAGKDRRITAQTAVERFGATVLILDDGFQYRRLHVDEHIVLLDATQPFGTGRLFPAGTLRDPASALRRAAEVWITRADHPSAVPLDALTQRVAKLAPGVPVRRTVHAPARLLAGDAELPVTALRDQQVVALAGIGNPQAFRATLAGLGAEVVREAFYPDHHPYSPDELAMLARDCADLVVVTTEKDWMRLDAWPQGDGLAPLWVLGIELRFV